MVPVGIKMCAFAAFPAIGGTAVIRPCWCDRSSLFFNSWRKFALYFTCAVVEKERRKTEYGRLVYKTEET